MSTTAGEWADLCGALPDHGSEVMSARPGRPTPAEAVDRGVTPAPAEDNGVADDDKYAHGGY